MAFKLSSKLKLSFALKGFNLVYEDININVYNNCKVIKNQKFVEPGFYDVVVVNSEGKVVLEYRDDQPFGKFEPVCYGKFYYVKGYCDGIDFHLDMGPREIFFNPDSYKVFATDLEFTGDTCFLGPDLGNYVVLKYRDKRYYIKDLEDISGGGIDTFYEMCRPYDYIKVFDKNLMIGYNKSIASYDVYCKNANNLFGFMSCPLAFSKVQLAQDKDGTSFIMSTFETAYFMPTSHVLMVNYPCSEIWLEKVNEKEGFKVFGKLEDGEDKVIFDYANGFITYADEEYLTDFFNDVRFLKSGNIIKLIDRRGREITSFEGELKLDFMFRADFSPIISGYFATALVDGELIYIDKDGYKYNPS